MPKKIGIVGNSCTGKSTVAFGIIRWLKLQKALVGYCTDAARFVTFNPEKFDTDPHARLNVLFTQLRNETEQLVRDDVDYIVMERTALDWMIYYEWTCAQVGQTGLYPGLDELMSNWMNTYDLLIFLDSASMVYVNDGFRPASTKIRDEVDADYREFREILETHAEFAGRSIIVSGSDLGLRNIEAEQKFGEWFLRNKIIRPSRVTA